MPLTEDNEFYYESNKHPICPKCDEEIIIEECELFSLYEEDRHKVKCPNCLEEIIIESHCQSWEFSTNDPENL